MSMHVTTRYIGTQRTRNKSTTPGTTRGKKMSCPRWDSRTLCSVGKPHPGTMHGIPSSSSAHASRCKLTTVFHSFPDAQFVCFTL